MWLRCRHSDGDKRPSLLLQSCKTIWNKRVELPKKKRREQKNKKQNSQKNCFPGRKSLQSLRCRPGLPDLPFGLSMQLPFETCIERENVATAGPLVCAICPICAICVPSLFFLWFFGNKNGNSVTIEAKTGPDRQVQSRKRHGFLAFSKKKHRKLEAHSNIEKPWQCMPVTFWDKQLSTIIQTGHSKPDKIRSELTGGYQMWGLLS